ncbi:AI-2E family transporter [Tenacibaculum finnmarkense]|uniref:AI-2E family transporter n=1 Tax=Tenacibaculum finnmarkense genomovar finnmarkense TaxID=1458503 RepID=A0AAP1RD01_9FLAO|nr:AI-2E family transporter [Tenacibaculum finnmarkense]MBE7651797.1 AI-2E family transporter [Tenacibaculum finnmarkense genomovar finnmarkense]MBE7659398.1 AI-2E family transporter [Tenacibaculum finnmarkense genomovar finnmarkense]MBE7692124.1 AI-2E family transporter [Tenacibaculum finnmarkense genomovar finnmarkense]MBE7693853.1 AI-2E family transporter [Tenacibaculum finnmarkense genomovar finnmarkense]MCD8402361.1 AI-2E family transporter [Tenacibaculum finnmarkense genomovar finnmarken
MKNSANFIIIIGVIIATLVIGKGIIIPFIFALIFWFLTREIRKNIYKIPFAKKFIPIWLSNVFVFTIIIFSFSFMSEIITNSIVDLSTSYSKYEPNIDVVIKNLNNYFHIDIIKSAKLIVGDFNYGAVLAETANAISSLLGDTFMIIIYALFMFLEESSFKKKLHKLFSGKDTKNTSIQFILSKIEVSISNYLRLKTYVSLLTGILSYFILLLMGVDSAPFWAFLIFLLNYIPTIGSLIATIFPAVFSLIQFGELSPFLIVLIAVGAVQVIVGNFIEPKVFGKSLNLSPLVTILSLAIWGKIWGVTGMVLSVPITVIMIIVFSQFERTKTVAIFLSENGEIDTI